MISDGDSSAFEAVKHTYVNVLLKNLATQRSSNNRTQINSMDENIDAPFDSSTLQLSSEQYKSNIVTREDCINHVKKHVPNHLKILKNRYSGLENVPEENLALPLEEDEHAEKKKNIPSYSSARSTSNDVCATVNQTVVARVA